MRWPVPAATATAFLAVAAPAVAAWSVSGSAAGGSSAGAVTAPSSVTVPATSTNGTVAVSWAGATGPSGSALRYLVERLVGTTATSVCGSSFAAPITGSSCTDSSVPDGVYRYRVTTRLGASWLASSSDSSPVTVTTVAALAVSTPDLDSASDSGSANGDNITNVQTPTFTGTATAGSTVRILNGTTVVATGTATAGGTYSLTATTLSGGAGTNHTITATATLGVATVSSPGSLSVHVDTQAPAGLTVSCAFTSGSNYTCNGVAGTATNDSATVTLTIRAGATVVAGPASVTRTGGSWTYSSSNLNNNTDFVATVVQADAAGNTSTTASAIFRR